MTIGNQEMIPGTRWTVEGRKRFDNAVNSMLKLIEARRARQQSGNKPTEAVKPLAQPVSTIQK